MQLTLLSLERVIADLFYCQIMAAQRCQNKIIENSHLILSFVIYHV